jgi:hypothetical protein
MAGAPPFHPFQVMAWVALDRAIKAFGREGDDGPHERWRSLASDAHDEWCVSWALARCTDLQYPATTPSSTAGSCKALTVKGAETQVRVFCRPGPSMRTASRIGAVRL